MTDHSHSPPVSGHGHELLEEACLDCKKPIYWCEVYHDYFHVLGIPPCFLIQRSHP